jgi:hypothetical protein
MLLGWSETYLAKVSGVSAASIYLIERMGSAGDVDDGLIRAALAHGKEERFRRVSNRVITPRTSTTPVEVNQFELANDVG